MNGSINGGSSGRPSPRNGDENLSMFFDFGSPAQGSSRSYQTTSAPQSHESQPRGGGIRVSLACIPCRSRHVKCGAEMPNCSRCVQDDKPCFYAKSRRGMRDRNAPRKRASMREASKDVDGLNGNALNHVSYPIGGSSSESYSHTGPSSTASNSPQSSSSKLSGKGASPRRLLDLYYNFFHKAHPFVLPRYYFLARLESDPESLKFLLPVMQYIGSLYASDVSSSELKETALNNLDLPTLPPNGFTVLALHLSAIAMQCVDEWERARALLDRAIFLALELRMNSRTFANMERDPVLAESWRRTYWGLYITDGTFAGKRRAPTFILYTIEANVELPCEECDYDGIIPRPHTLAEYESRDFEDEAPVFSSFTYLIDLTRIAGALLGLDRLSSKDLEPAVTNADAMLVNWKLHLPREKQGVVDKNEEIDELLFQAQNLLQVLLITIHRPLSRLYHSPIEKTSQCAPPPPVREITGNEDRTYWLHTKKTLEAAETAINLYALPCHILQHTPLMICGLALSTLANLSACTYMLSGSEWYKTRDRIRLALGGLKAFGEVWASSRRTERETKKIARDVFALPRAGNLQIGNGMGVGGGGSGSGSSSVIFDLGFADENREASQDTMVGWADLAEMDYLSMLDGVGQQNLNRCVS